MRISNRGKVLLVGAFILAGAAGWAQLNQKPAQWGAAAPHKNQQGILTMVLL